MNLGRCIFLTLFSCVSVACINVQASEQGKRTWSPGEYGAKADGSTLDTAAFQEAIDRANTAGGGTVVVSPGRYLMGSITLRTGVHLELKNGATLLGSPRLSDYHRGIWPALILARDQERIGISGGGKIDGNGELLALDTMRIFDSGQYLELFPGLRKGETILADPRTNEAIDPERMQLDGLLRARVSSGGRREDATWRVAEFVRPQIIEFVNCRHVQMDGITLVHASNWVQSYRGCDDLHFSGVHVDSTSCWNNDGMDLVDCCGVWIDSCDINASDDGICIKSESPISGRFCENIDIRRCRIRSSASAIKLGTASRQGFRHIRAEDIEVYDTYRAALAIEMVDGGAVEDVDVSRVRARNTGCAVFLRIGQRDVARRPGHMSDIVLRDFDVQVSPGRPDKGYEHQGPAVHPATNIAPSLFVGLPDRPIEGVTLRNFKIVAGGGGLRRRAEIPLDHLAAIPEARSDYPEFSMFGELPAWGFFMRHVKNIHLENVCVGLGKADYRAALVADDVQGLVVEGLTIGSKGEEPLVVFAGRSIGSLRHVNWPTGVNDKIRCLDGSITE